MSSIIPFALSFALGGIFLPLTAPGVLASRIERPGWRIFAGVLLFLWILSLVISAIILF
jgi:hypothetical protein